MSDDSNIPGRECNKTEIPEENREHILLVDDVLLVQAEKQMLEELGYYVTTCTSSASALALFHDLSERIDCVVSSLSMPRFNGLALANTCKLCRPGTPFILISDDAIALPGNSLRALGIRGYVLRPLSLRILEEALHNPDV